VDGGQRLLVLGAEKEETREEGEMKEGEKGRGE